MIFVARVYDVAHPYRKYAIFYGEKEKLGGWRKSEKTTKKSVQTRNKLRYNVLSDIIIYTLEG